MIDGRLRSDLKGLHPTAIAIDPQKNSNRVYCGTWDNGLWKTDDNGQTWNQIKTLILYSDANIMSLSVSPIEKEEEEGFNKVFVGTEPSDHLLI